MTRVRVYKNLHRSCYSIQINIGSGKWRVWKYATELIILEPKFIVREKGRQRVIKEKKKNVHAFIEGVLSDQKPPKFSATMNPKIFYDPYKYEYFWLAGAKSIDANDHHFSFVHLSEDGVYI